MLNPDECFFCDLMWLVMKTQEIGQALHNAQSDPNFGHSCKRENQGPPKACLIYIHNSVHCLYVGYRGVSLIIHL